MQYKSKPHRIQGVQFRSQGLEFTPDWIKQAYEKGRIQITLNDKEKYVTIYDKHGGVRHAYVGDWVCMNESETIFPLTEEEFERGFEPDYDVCEETGDMFNRTT